MIGRAMSRTGHALFLAAAVLAVAPARAREPPPSKADIIRRENEAAVEQALTRCSAEVARRGEFRVVTVEFPYRPGKTFAPKLASRTVGLDRSAYWCVAEALKALRLDPLPERDSFGFDGTRDYAVGDVRSLFPADLVPAWQGAGKGRDRVEAALRFKLPANVTVTDTGCLWFGQSEPLTIALWKWLHGKFGKPFGETGLHEYDYALPGGWWLRHSTSDDEAELCLDKLDAAAGALRRRRDDLYEVASYRPFHAEWIVDAEGTIQGEIGLCLRPHEGGRAYTGAETSEIRQNVEKVLRASGYGRGSGMRLVRLDWSSNGRLDTSVQSLKQAVTLDRSKIEARCDPRRALACARAEEQPDFDPAGEDALFRCMGEASVNAHMVSMTFDVSPDGLPENVVAGAIARAVPIPATALRCLEVAFKEAHFTRSDGGPCRVSRPLDAFVEPGD